MFKQKYERYLSAFNEYAEEYFKKLTVTPAVLKESMAYSFINGGKRVRPVLMLAAADILGVEQNEALPFALAIEMIHTYSLIHDDLPAMDNDDFRRGKPSCHKAFGEGHAVLAGDALLNTAYSVCFDECFKGEKYVRAAKTLCEYAGVNGMIAGQSADLLQAENDSAANEETLRFIDEHKTGKLILASLLVPCVLADNKNYFEFEQFGKYLGTLFQITDDILDETSDFSALGKTTGKDKQENKLTFVSLYGLDGAKIQADIYASDAYAVLDGINADVSFLHDFITYVRNREK
ncbi:MAG: farnesyl diphosphate synthase [Candidatus Borkfalkiaceae bacterium]|nr:polyprenyl synthetase family protein [Clostridia bacterium]MDY6224011.1 farnesyl diphosphate synthase [Christensenellaceae bacterium]